MWGPRCAAGAAAGVPREWRWRLPEEDLPEDLVLPLLFVPLPPAARRLSAAAWGAMGSRAPLLTRWPGACRQVHCGLGKSERGEW